MEDGKSVVFNCVFDRLKMNTEVMKADKSGTYPGHKLYYTSGGEDRTKNWHEKGCKFPPVSTLLSEAQSWEEGQKFYLVMTKNGEYSDITNYGTGDAPPDVVAEGQRWWHTLSFPGWWCSGSSLLSRVSPTDCHEGSH